MALARRTITTLLVSLILLPAVPAFAAHPSLLFDGAGLSRLRAARTTTHAEIAGALRGAMEPQLGRVLSSSQFGDPRLLGNVLAGDAIAAQVLDDAGYRAMSKANLLAALRWSDWGFGDGDDLNRAHLIIGVAVAYDVLHSELTDAERASVRTRLGTEAQRFASAISRGIWWKTDWLQNHNWINFAALGLAGHALEGEDSRAAGWVAAAETNSAILKRVLDLIDDGSWHEGISYQQYGWSFAMPYWMASARRGVDVSDHAMLRENGVYRLYAQLPDFPSGYVTTHGDWSGWAGVGSAQVLRYVASRFQDGRAQEAARRWVSGTRRSSRAEDTFYMALEYLAYDASVPGTDVDAIAKDFHATDQDLMIMRSGWTAGSLVAAFKAGVLGGRGNFERLRTGGAPGGSLNISHDHMDDLGLWLYGDGEWLLPECVGYNIGRTSGPKAWMTEFQNALLIDGVGELGDDKGDEDNGLAHPWFFGRRASLTRVASTANYAFSRADGAALFSSSLGVESLERTVAMAREGWMVLADDLSFATPRTPEQLFHAMDSASTSSGWIRANSHNDRALGIRVVSPPVFAASITSQTADKLTKQFEPDGSVSLIRVRPTAPATEAHFLELLWPTRGASWGQRPTVTPLDDAHPERGFVLPLQSGREVWVTPGAPAGDGYRTDAPMGVVREDGSGALVRAAVLGAGRIERGGQPILMAPSGTAALEVSYDGAFARLSGTVMPGAAFVAGAVSEVVQDGRPLSWNREGEWIVIASPAAVPDAGAPIEDPPDASLDGADAGATTVDGGGAGRLPHPLVALIDMRRKRRPGPQSSANSEAIVSAVEASGCRCSSVGWDAGTLFVLVGALRRRRQKARCTNQ